MTRYTVTRMPFLLQNLCTIHTKTKEHPPNLSAIQQQTRPAMATPAPVPTKVSSEKLDANGGHASEFTAVRPLTAASEPKVVLVVLHSNATGEPIVRQISGYCVSHTCRLLIPVCFHSDSSSNVTRLRRTVSNHVLLREFRHFFGGCSLFQSWKWGGDEGCC